MSAYLRVYHDDKPLDTRANYLRYAKADAQPGDLTFTSGHPGSTHRLDTVAQLEFRRDRKLPRSIISQSELRGHLTEFSTKGAEQARIARGKLFEVENSLKVSKGQFEALVDPAIIKGRAIAEQALRAKVDADPAAAGAIRRGLGQYPRDARALPQPAGPPSVAKADRLRQRAVRLCLDARAPAGRGDEARRPRG